MEIADEKNATDENPGVSQDAWRPLRSRSFLTDAQVGSNKSKVLPFYQYQTKKISGGNPTEPFQEKPLSLKVRTLCSGRADRSKQASRPGNIFSCDSDLLWLFFPSITPSWPAQELA